MNRDGCLWSQYDLYYESVQWSPGTVYEPLEYLFDVKFTKAMPLPYYNNTRNNVTNIDRQYYHSNKSAIGPMCHFNARNLDDKINLNNLALLSLSFPPCCLMAISHSTTLIFRFSKFVAYKPILSYCSSCTPEYSVEPKDSNNLGSWSTPSLQANEHF